MGTALIWCVALQLVSVDARVQAAADRLGAEAVVVLDVASGAVLARSGHDERALPSGSIFKLVAALAAAQRPTLLSATTRCTGRAQLSGQDIRCWRPAGHGALELEEAIAHSCNIWFGALGEQLGTPALLATARVLGVGAPPGQLPPADAPAARVADGDGVRVTALQLAQLARQLALGRRSDGVSLGDPALLARVRHGMRAAVEHGTAMGAAGTPPPAGKTGTTVAGEGSIGWFVGWAPVDAPTVVVAIARRDARGTEVARDAQPLFLAFFHGR